jgi:hypothetical protein
VPVVFSLRIGGVFHVKSCVSAMIDFVLLHIPYVGDNTCVGRGRASYLSIHRKPIPCLLPHALGSSLLAHPFKSRPHIHHTHRGRLGARRALFNPFLPWLARLLIYYGYKYITGSHVHKMSVHLGSLPHGSCLATSLSHSLTIALSRL